MVMVWGSVTVLFGLSPGVAAAEPTAFTLRYQGSGWADLRQAGAAVLACPDNAAACQDGSDPAVATAWVDVDTGDEAVNSSRAGLVIPPRASVDWVGLYWAGDRGARAGGAAPRCDAAPETAAPAGLPPAPERANQVQVRVNGEGYVRVTASSLTDVTGPAGGAGFQAYADITALLRPLSGRPAAAEVALTVADIQVAHGPGCAGGWTAVLAYSYPDGPDSTNAPTYRSLAVFDGVTAAPAGAAQEVRLAGLTTPAEGAVDARLVVSLLASGQAVGSDALTVGGAVLGRPSDGAASPGYRVGSAPAPPAAVRAGATEAAVGVTAARDAFVAAVFGLSTQLPVRVDLSVATAVTPTTVAVGGEATVTVTLRNDATLAATGVVVTARLPAGLTLIEAVPGYDVSTGAWSVGRVAAGGTAALSLWVRVTESGTMTASAEVTASAIADVDSTPGDGATTQDDLAVGTVTGLAPSPTAAAPSQEAQPAVVGSEPMIPIRPAVLFGIGLFALGLLILSIIVIRNRAS